MVEGAAKGEVVIKGSFENHPKLGDFRPQAWKQVPGTTDLYLNDWPYDTHVEAGPWINSYGFAMLPGVMQRSEMIWVDGENMRQVLAEKYRWVDPDGKRGVDDYGTGGGGDRNNQDGKLVFEKRVMSDPVSDLKDPGSFAVFTAEEVKDNLHGKIYLRLPKGKSIEQISSIEVAEWKGRSWTPMMVISNKKNLVVRNLTVSHGNMGQMATAVSVNSCENFIIEDCDFSHNVAAGFKVTNSKRGHVLRVTSNYNGGNGMGAGNNSRQILLEDCETSFNNQRGGWVGWLAWHASGFKSGNVHNFTVRRHVSVGNAANGIWFDVYCTNVLVEDSLLYGNKRMGVMFELTRPKGGPHILRNSICAENDNTGVYLTMASNSRVEDCLVIRNGGGGYVENEQKFTQLLYKFRDHPHGPNSPEEWVKVEISRNLFLSDLQESRTIDYLDRRAEPLTQYDRVLKVLHSDNNRYGTTLADGYRLPDGSWTDFEGWKSLLAEKGSPVGDTQSTWDLSGLDPDREKEFTTASSSEVSQIARQMGVPLPQDRLQEYWQRTHDGKFKEPYLHYQQQHD